MEARTVHIVDDDAAIRNSTRFLLEAADFAVREYDSGTTFLRGVRDEPAGCILLDVRMPGMDGLEVQRQLKARDIAMPVIVLTGHGDVSTAVLAMQGGAVDFLEKPFERAVLLAAIETAFQRLDHDAGGLAARREAEHKIATLAPRERDVLQGLVRGFPNKTIAYDLGISPRTVEVYRANLMSKLNVRSLSEALRIAFAAGLAEEMA